MSCLAERQRLGFGSWLDVIANIPKFSATLEQPEARWPSVWSPEWIKLSHAVDGIFDGSINLGKGAIYWFDSAVPVTNPWFQEKILGNRESHPIVANMNSIMFLK